LRGDPERRRNISPSFANCARRRKPTARKERKGTLWSNREGSMTYLRGCSPIERMLEWQSEGGETKGTSNLDASISRRPWK